MRAPGAVGACALIAVVVTGCPVGGWDGAVTSSRFGSEVRVETSTGEMRGELLLVQDDGIVFVASDRGLFAPWPSMRKLSFSGYPVADLKDGLAPDAIHRRQMTLASRYAHGLTDAQWARVLESLNQEELERIP